MNNNKTYGIIYRAYYIEDNRSYIGQTIKKLARRISEHKCGVKSPIMHFHRALAKYGFDKFKFEILQECATFDELNDAEIYWIKYYDSIENGFNINTGGNVAGMGMAARKKLSEERKGEGNPMFGKVGARGKHTGGNIPTKFKKGGIPWNKGKKGYKTCSKLNFEQANGIRKLYDDQVLVKDICIQFNIAPNTVYDIINNRILIKEGKKPKIKQDIVNQILDNIKLGMSANKTAKQLNISVLSVCRYARELIDIINIKKLEIKLEKDKQIKERIKNKEPYSKIKKELKTSIYYIKKIEKEV